MHWGLKAGAAPAGPDIPTEAPARSGVGSGLPWGPRFALSSSQSLSRPDTIYLFTARLLLRAQEFVWAGSVCLLVTVSQVSRKFLHRHLIYLLND